MYSNMYRTIWSALHNESKRELETRIYVAIMHSFFCFYRQAFSLHNWINACFYCREPCHSLCARTNTHTHAREIQRNRRNKIWNAKLADNKICFICAVHIFCRTITLPILTYIDVLYAYGLNLKLKWLNMSIWWCAQCTKC